MYEMYLSHITFDMRKYLFAASKMLLSVYVRQIGVVATNTSKLQFGCGDRTEMFYVQASLSKQKQKM